MAAQFETVAAAAEGCDALVATGLMPAGVRTIAERLGIPYVCAVFNPRSAAVAASRAAVAARAGRSRRARPTTGCCGSWTPSGCNALYGPPLNAHRAALGLPPVDNVRDHVFTDRPWLAADPILAPWPGSPDLDVVQTGAWILPDERPLPADLEAFLDAGAPPVYVGFGSVRAPEDAAAGGHRGDPRAGTSRSHLPGLGRAWL